MWNWSEIFFPYLWKVGASVVYGYVFVYIYVVYGFFLLLFTFGKKIVFNLRKNFGSNIVWKWLYQNDVNDINDVNINNVNDVNVANNVDITKLVNDKTDLLTLLSLQNWP